jgi:Fur family peroxide stress response transcriptional regulator
MRETTTPRSGGARRRSALRDRILELLKGTGSHPTANWLYGKLRREFPDLSLGTIYRNLGILVEQGAVNRIDYGSTFDRYDAKTLPHYHFICENCGTVTDLEIPVDPALNRLVDRKTGVTVARHEIEFYGQCAACREKA